MRRGNTGSEMNGCEMQMKNSEAIKRQVFAYICTRLIRFLR